MLSRDRKKLIQDTDYYAALLEKNAVEIKADLIKSYRESGGDLDGLLSSVSRQLSSINCRLQVVETIMSANLKVNSAEKIRVSNGLDGLLKEGNVLSQVSVDQLSNMVNFYDVETINNNFRYVWTGPKPVTSIKVSNTPNQQVEIWIGVVQAVTEGILNSLTFTVNGVKCDHTLIDNNGERFAVIKHLDPQDQLDINIVTSTTLKPIEIGTSPDVRELGIAISKLLVKAAIR